MTRYTWMAAVVVACFCFVGCSGKGPDDKAKKEAEQKPGIVKRIGDGVKATGESVGEFAGESVGKAAKGLVRGAEAGALAADIRVADTLAKRGVRSTRAQHLFPNKDGKGDHGLSIYVISEEPLAATLVLKAFDKDGQEVGRTLADVDFKKDDAGYVDFRFDARVPMVAVQYYTLDLSQAKPPAASTTPGAPEAGNPAPRKDANPTP